MEEQEHRLYAHRERNCISKESKLQSALWNKGRTETNTFLPPTVDVLQSIYDEQMDTNE